MSKTIGVLVIGLLLSAFSRNVCADEVVGAACWYTAFAAGDLASTEYALDRGAIELNPLMKNQGTRYALKVAQVAGFTWLDHKLSKRDRKLRWAVRILYAGAHGYVIAHNIREARKR